MAKGKCLLRPKSLERDKKLLDNGVGALSKVLEAYMSEAVYATDPTRGKKAWPTGIGPTWGHSCQVCLRLCSVVPARQ